jgi:hypothetical protein
VIGGVAQWQCDWVRVAGLWHRLGEQLGQADEIVGGHGKGELPPLCHICRVCYNLSYLQSMLQ